MKAIIFGAGGQDGYYLSKLLASGGHNVVKVSRREGFTHCDVGDFESVSTLIKSECPDLIFHFAAQSSAAHETLFENHTAITAGTLNILEAVKRFSPQSKVFITGSGLQFENSGRKIKETDPFHPGDIYSVCRIQSVFTARYYRSLGLKVYVGYLYNHDSPLRTERHVAKKISEAVKQIAAGTKSMLSIGAAEVIKEWAFAGDIVKGILLLVGQNEIFEANVSNGEGYPILDYINLCFAEKGLDPGKYLVSEEGFVPAYPSLISDNSLIRSLGYSPEVNFPQLVKMMMA